MPPAIMDQNQRMSFFLEEPKYPTDMQVGFWKLESAADNRGPEEMSMMAVSKSLSPSPMGKLRPIGPSSVERPKFSQQYLFNDQKLKFGINSNLLGANDQDIKRHSNLHDIHFETGLFSSSLSELFDRKLKVSSEIVSLPSMNRVDSNSEEEVPLECSKEIEAQTIGDLLPDDDDLLFGAVDDADFIHPINNEEFLDDDIFCSGGGLELGDMTSDNANIKNNNLYAGEHPSRTISLRNIDGNVEDKELKMLFEQYGDIQMLYTARKHQGFVMVSYYDIRAAQNAMKSLQNKAFKHRKLDIHYSFSKDNPSLKDVNQGTLVVSNLDSSVSNDYLHQKLSVYGEIKEICETPHRPNHKLVEFYDVRAAENALHALNGSVVAGEETKLEPSLPGGAKWSLIQQLPSEIESEGATNCRRVISPSSSPPIHYGSVPIRSVMALENETAHDFHSALRAPINPLLNPSLHGFSSSGAHNMSSPVRIASAGNQRDHSMVHGENGHSYGFQNVPMMHPHSLPEYHDGIQYNSSPMHSMAVKINPRHEGIDNRFIQRVGLGSLTSHSFHSSSYGGIGNSSCPVNGNNQYNAYSHPSPTPILWNNSPSFMNNIPPHHSPQMHGLPRAPAHMLNHVLPFHPHHVGSAPTANPSIWERRHAEYTHNIFDQGCVPSHQQNCHMFHGVNHMVPMHASFDAPSDRLRGRRNDMNSSQVDNKKQYELDIERIIRGDDTRTTLMIKNIPNKYTSKILLAAIDENHKGTYDFIYLPIDFKNKCNVGYAFINMVDPKHIVPFFQAFNGKKWEKFNSEKVASLAYARIQGKAALIAHFQNSSLMNEDKRCRPIIFHSDGPNAGDQEPFPVGISIRSRPGRYRTYNSEDSIYESSSSSPNNT